MEEKIRNVILISFEKAVEDISLELENRVDSTIYSSPKSKYYDRTGNFLKSVANPKIKINNDTASYSLYDKTKIHSQNGVMKISRRNKPYMIKFGHHRSWPWDNPFPDDDEVKENLFDWLNDGFSILNKKHHKGFYFDFDTDKELEKAYIKHFMIESKKINL